MMIMKIININDELKNNRLNVADMDMKKHVCIQLFQ